MHNRTATLTATPAPISELVEDFLVSLEAEGKSHRTLTAYGDSLRGFLGGHRDTGDAEVVLDRASASGYLADLRRRGNQPATRRSRYTAVRQFSKWLETGGEATRTCWPGCARRSWTGPGC